MPTVSVERRRTSARLDRRPARGQLARPRHHHPAAGVALRRPPSPVGDPPGLQPRARRRRLGGPRTASSSRRPTHRRSSRCSPSRPPTGARCAVTATSGSRSCPPSCGCRVRPPAPPARPAAAAAGGTRRLRWTSAIASHPLHRRADVTCLSDRPERIPQRQPDPARREPGAAAAPRRRSPSSSIYIDPPFNTGRVQTRRTLAGGARRGRRADGLSGAPLPHEAARRVLLPRLLRGLPRRSSRRAWNRPTGCSRARARSTSTSTTASPTTASCCSTRSSAASAFSTRSSGPTTTARAPSAAGRPSTTRSSSTSRTRSAYYFDSEEVDREPYMAPGLVTAEKAARGKLPDGRLVAHDRAHQRPREDRLPDPEAGGHRPAHGPGLHAPGRLVP